MAVSVRGKRKEYFVKDACVWNQSSTVQVHGGSLHAEREGKKKNKGRVINVPPLIFLLLLLTGQAQLNFKEP